VLLLFHDPTIQEHPVEYDQHVTLHAVPVNFKKMQADAVPSLSCVTSSLLNPAFSSSSDMGESKKSFHPSGKFLCTSFSFQLTHACSASIGMIFALQKLNKIVQNTPKDSLFYTVLYIALVIIRYTRPFRICKEWKREGFSP